MVESLWNPVQLGCELFQNIGNFRNAYFWLESRCDMARPF